MFHFPRLALVLSLILSISLASPGFSNGEGGGQGQSAGGGGGAAGLSNAVTKSVAKTISNGVIRCQRVEKIYRFDCYRQVYKLAASYLFGRPAYDEALKALTVIETALEQIIAKEADPQKPPIRQGLQQYTAIKPEAVHRATASLESALSEAETMLLRAPERAGTQYTRIAEAVNSNKVLLRSRLDPNSQELFRTAFA